jgi:hypothetical protein
MNYREWLVYRAHQHVETATEPGVLRYAAWRNHQALRDWNRRVDAALLDCAAHAHYARDDAPVDRAT